MPSPQNVSAIIQLGKTEAALSAWAAKSSKWEQGYNQKQGMGSSLIDFAFLETKEKTERRMKVSRAEVKRDMEGEETGNFC